MAELRVVFMGTPEFAAVSLDALLALKHAGDRNVRVVGVVTQPDRPSGRGNVVKKSPVKLRAVEAGVPVLQPERLRRPEHVAELRALQPNLIVVAAFAQILSQDVLDMPAYGCLNIHASLLPRWRGASPISAAILAGDAETGMTIMRMDAGLDTGPIIATRSTPVLPSDTTGSLTERLAHLGADLLTATIGPWINGSLIAQEQPENGVIATTLTKKEDGRIDFQTIEATQLERMTRAYTPWPGTFTMFNGKLLKIWEVDVVETSAAPSFAPGHVLTRDEAAAYPLDTKKTWPQALVATSDGVVRLRRVQLEGRSVVDGSALMAGQHAPAALQF